VVVQVFCVGPTIEVNFVESTELVCCKFQVRNLGRGGKWRCYWKGSRYGVIEFASCKRKGAWGCRLLKMGESRGDGERVCK
jgi:hypothetical protein